MPPAEEGTFSLLYFELLSRGERGSLESSSRITANVSRIIHVEGVNL